ncbi:hypothetical protein [Rhodoblastus sp.]|uniref:hypothetical protein n=1 Tax=Rhodoblastus sp. TaxID=1962975 RepID=UPI003F99E984
MGDIDDGFDEGLRLLRQIVPDAALDEPVLVTVARRRQRGRDIDVALDVIGPAMQEHDSRPFGGTCFRISDIEDTGVDLLQRGEGAIGSRLRCGGASLRLLSTDRAEFRSGDGEGRSAKKAAAIRVNRFGGFGCDHQLNST